MQNIGADNAGDAFYRYKMPKLQAKIEGRGNGIKTNIVNNVDIAKSLERPPTYTLKYFGFDLGAQTNFDEKTGVSIVNGAHDAKKLAEILETFIKKYVQCYNCGNPETVIKIKKECIHLKCKACGGVSDVDMRDKLTSFIIKNPPEVKLSKAEAKVKRETKERMKETERELRKAEKAEKKRKDSVKKKSSTKGSGDEAADEPAEHVEASEEVAEDDDDDTVWKTDMSEDAVRKRQQEQLTAAAAALVQSHVEKDEAGNAAKSEASEAVKDAESANKENGMGNDAEDDEDEQEEEEDDEQLLDASALRKAIDSRGAKYVADALKDLEVEGGIVGKMKLFWEALLGEYEGKYVERIKAKDLYIVALSRDDQTAQASQLIALEYFLTQVKPERMAEIPFILKMLYEEDVIDEDIIVMWGEHHQVAKKHGVDAKSAKEIRAIAQPVLDWLQEDSDEDEEDEDEDED